MIDCCPECGREFGVTHGDQLFRRRICEECVNVLEALESTGSQNN